MVVADDYHQEAGGEPYRFALVAFFLICSTCGVPLSWDKTAGGKTSVWVGFELLHSTHHLGISQRRAEWFTMWAREVAEKWPRFEEGLGRIMSWEHLKLKDNSSDPSIDSCHSIPSPQLLLFPMQPIQQTTIQQWMVMLLIKVGVMPSTDLVRTLRRRSRRDVMPLPYHRRAPPWFCACA